ncbi:hypothetical protein [Paenibacillus sp. NPDC057967]|uniref:hypothetical protein n=1 Tax=Paenibacillus sp. NPDC057967 TaxID=3346293 RepID=UPI0036DE6246
MNKQHTFIPFGAPTAPQLDGLSIIDIFEKAARYDEVLKANNTLVKRVGELEHQLAEANLQEIEAFLAPSFPKDFQYLGNERKLRDEEIQELVIEATGTDLQDGEYQFISFDNTVVIRLHDGDKIVTVVGKDFYEATEPVLEPTCDEDCTCFSRSI